MNIIQRELDSIRPYAANAKKHDATQVANVAESIRQYGFVQPIVIDKDGVIVIGHCRALAAKKLGMTEVPCVCVEDLTPEQVKALRVIDNKTNESPWDMDLLAAELPGLDLDGFDFDWGLNAVDENDVPNVEEKELKPFNKVHYLISADVNSNDKIIQLVKQLESLEGVEIDSTLN